MCLQLLGATAIAQGNPLQVQGTLGRARTARCTRVKAGLHVVAVRVPKP